MKRKDSKKKEKKEKNFCDACGLYKVLKACSDEEGKKNEEYFKKLEDLGIRAKKKFGRDMSAIGGGFVTSKFCVLSHKIWIKKGKRKILWMEKRCKDFQPRLPSLELSDYVSFHTTNKNSRTANCLAIIVILIAGAGLLLIIFATEIKCFLKNLF